jgi:hypothetical protein
MYKNFLSKFKEKLFAHSDVLMAKYGRSIGDGPSLEMALLPNKGPTIGGQVKPK